MPSSEQTEYTIRDDEPLDLTCSSHSPEKSSVLPMETTTQNDRPPKRRPTNSELAFGAFVRRLTQELLDYRLPITQQSFPKLLRIESACRREFPQFDSRQIRLKIRAQLKLYRRSSKKSEERTCSNIHRATNNDRPRPLLPLTSGKPTPTHAQLNSAPMVLLDSGPTPTISTLCDYKSPQPIQSVPSDVTVSSTQTFIPAIVPYEFSNLLASECFKSATGTSSFSPEAYVLPITCNPMPSNGALPLFRANMSNIQLPPALNPGMTCATSQPESQVDRTASVLPSFTRSSGSPKLDTDGKSALGEHFSDRAAEHTFGQDINDAQRTLKVEPILPTGISPGSSQNLLVSSLRMSAGLLIQTARLFELLGHTKHVQVRSEPTHEMAPPVPASHTSCHLES